MAKRLMKIYWTGAVVFALWEAEWVVNESRGTHPDRSEPAHKAFVVALCSVLGLTWPLALGERVARKLKRWLRD